jgi:ABC-type glycerol-3-phosphate transport system permease component
MLNTARIFNAFIFVLLLTISLIFLIPLAWTVLTSIKIDKEIYSPRIVFIPSEISFEHYVKVLFKMDSFLNFFRNTVIATFWSILATTIFSAMAGYAFAKLNFAGKNIFFVFVLLVIALPYAIYLIPIYIMADRMGLIDTIPGIVFPYIATNLPMSIFIMRGQFKTIPDELGEAAIIDGSNFFQTWYRIMLPIAKPGLAIIIIFTFINVWGEFLFARTLTQSPASQTLSVGITHLRDEATSWRYGTLTATITMSLVPLLAIFLAMQRFFIKGIIEGALKG